MKGSEPVVILSLKVDALEAKKVPLGTLRLVEDSPVKRCPKLQVFLVDIHALNFDEVVNTDGFISLGRHMQHIASLFISKGDVCVGSFDQRLKQLIVAVKGRKM